MEVHTPVIGNRSAFGPLSSSLSEERTSKIKSQVEKLVSRAGAGRDSGEGYVVVR
jgi:hypothetical protein